MIKNLKSIRNRPQLLNAVLTGIVLGVLGSVSAAAAGITVFASPVTAAPGSSANAFDVDLINSGPSALTIGGFSFSLSIANSNISFTEVTSSTEAGYIFSGDSLFGPDLSGPNSGDTISASDVVLIPLTGTIVSSGQTVGLGHVVFDVSADAPAGMFPVTLASFPGSTLSDASGSNINIDTLSPGQITITGITPEPSSFPLLLLLSAAAMLGRRRLQALAATK